MNEAERCFVNKRERLQFAHLAVKDGQPGANGPLEIIIPAPGPGKVVSPTHIRAHSQLTQCRGLLSNALSDLFASMDDRTVTIERLDPEGGPVANASFIVPLEHRSDFDRVFDLMVEVAAVQGVAGIENTQLRVAFNGVLAQERQYLLVNWKVLHAMDRP